MGLFYSFENLCLCPRKGHSIHFCSYSALSCFTELIEICSPIYLGWCQFLFHSNSRATTSGLVQTKFRRGSKMWHVDKCIWFSIIVLFSHKYISFYLIGVVLRVISVRFILYQVKFVKILNRQTAIPVCYNVKCIWSVATPMTLDASNTSDTCQPVRSLLLGKAWYTCF